MDVLNYTCPNCGATLAYDYKTGKLSCAHCGYEGDITEQTTEQLGEASANGGGVGTLTGEGLLSYTCSRCGGEILVTEDVLSTTCIYCGNQTMIPGNLEEEFTPNYIIGFKHGKDELEQAFLAMKKKRILAPSIFFTPQTIDKTKGIYVPHYLFDCDADGSITASATKVRRWSDSKYNYTETSHYHVERGGSASYVAIPVDGSTKFDDAMMDTVGTFDMSGLTDFNYAYLPGYISHHPDQKADEVDDRAKLRAKNSLKDRLRADALGYTTVTVTSDNIDVGIKNTSIALLPVWTLTTVFNKKPYRFAMNGQSGVLVGSTPISVLKSILCFVLSFLITLIPVQIGMMLFADNPEYVPLEELRTHQIATHYPLQDTSQKIYDYADLLTPSEEAELAVSISEFNVASELDMVVLTTEDTMGYYIETYALDFFDYSGFGFGEYSSGVILAVNMTDRQVAIMGSGEAAFVFDYETAEVMLDTIAPLLTGGYYSAAAEAFVTEATEHAGTPFTRTFRDIWVALLVALLVSVPLTGTLMYASYGKVKLATEAANFQVQGSLHIPHRVDRFLRRSVSKSSRSSSSSGGGGGGGSSGRSGGGSSRGF